MNNIDMCNEFYEHQEKYCNDIGVSEDDEKRFTWGWLEDIKEFTNTPYKYACMYVQAYPQSKEHFVETFKEHWFENGNLVESERYSKSFLQETLEILNSVEHLN